MTWDNANMPRPLTELTEAQRDQAMARFALLRRHVEDGVPLARLARQEGVPIRTARRWLSQYRQRGLIGLARQARADAGTHKMPADLVDLIKGMALDKPRPSVAALHRRLCGIAKTRGFEAPSYSTIYGVASTLDPHLMTLAHDGASAFRDHYELIFRHCAEKPNALWQADHTQLDILILDANGQAARPWLTVIMDDYSRAVAGYLVFLGAPSTLQTCLALRQAIWRKPDATTWPIEGTPDLLYVDHGSDFTSIHLDQVAANLRFQLVHSAVARPQGRGKVERLFGTVNTEVLCDLPGYLVSGRASTPPKLSLSGLDTVIGTYFIETYNARPHGETGVAPNAAWIAGGWLPRTPDSLQDLDVLLVMVAKSRVVRRDGIRFQGLRYLAPALAAYVGEAVTIRYDPRDVTEIRVFHRNRFVCCAVSPEHCGQTITLKDIQAARIHHRKALQTELRGHRRRVSDFVPRAAAFPKATAKPAPARTRPKRKLHVYFEDRRDD